jgi:hypothetical protein
MELKHKIKSIHAGLDPWNHDNGLAWYRNANKTLRGLAVEHGHSLETVAGIAAVLSPGTRWEQNLRDVMAVLQDGADAVVTTYHPNQVKAVKLLNGDTFDAVACKNKNTGNKVRSFYDNLLRPDDSEAVTIDRWVVRALYRDADKKLSRVFSSAKVYDEIADAFRKVAADRGLRPCELQAMVWLQVRPGSDQMDLF